MSDEYASVLGVLIGLTVVIFGGAALIMFGTAWSAEHLGALKPVGYLDSLVGFFIIGGLTTVFFGGKASS